MAQHCPRSSSGPRMRTVSLNNPEVRNQPIPSSVDETRLEQRRDTLRLLRDGTIVVVSAGGLIAAGTLGMHYVQSSTPEHAFDTPESQAARSRICEHAGKGRCSIVLYTPGDPEPDRIPQVILHEFDPTLLADLRFLPELRTMQVRLHDSSLVTDEQIMELAGYDLQWIAYESRLTTPHSSLGNLARAMPNTEVQYPIAQLAWNKQR